MHENTPLIRREYSEELPFLYQTILPAAGREAYGTAGLPAAGAAFKAERRMEKHV